MQTTNWKRRNSKKSFLCTPFSLSLTHTTLVDEAKQMPAEHRLREARRRKCVFCHIFFFSHAVKCRGMEARFNHRSVEQCSSLRQDPVAPLAVQIYLEKEREGKKNMLNMLLTTICCVIFLQVMSYFPFLFSQCDQSYKRVCHWEWVSVDRSQGRSEHPGQIFVIACFLFTPLCVWNASVFHGRQKHHHVEWCASWMLVVWKQHIIISLEARTEWSLQPPPLPTAVCSALIYALKSSVVWSVCLGDKSAHTMWAEAKIPLALMLFFCFYIYRSCQWMTMMWWTWSTRHWCWWWPAHSGTVIHLKMERYVQYITNPVK